MRLSTHRGGRDTGGVIATVAAVVFTAAVALGSGGDTAGGNGGDTGGGNGARRSARRDAGNAGGASHASDASHTSVAGGDTAGGNAGLGVVWCLGGVGFARRLFVVEP